MLSLFTVGGELKLTRWLRGFECELCGFKSRNQSKVSSHVLLFPRCYWDAVDKFVQESEK